MRGVTLLFAEYEFSVITGALHDEVRKRSKALRVFVIFISPQIKFCMVKVYIFTSHTTIIYNSKYYKLIVL